MDTLKQQESKSDKSADTVKRPAGVSNSATLKNVGEDGLPVYVWMEHVGPLIYKGVRYPHIQRVKYHYVGNRPTIDTFFFENMELRNGERNFNFKGCTVLRKSGDRHLYLANGKDTIFMFAALENYNGTNIYRGLKFVSYPTVSIKANQQYIPDDDLALNIKELGKSSYLVTLDDGTVLKYNLCSTCTGAKGPISFLNREDGRLYFANKNCYLELADNKDLDRIR
ncbi:hypothetical protein [Chitinophaga sp. HK235]|uniref:hypothetical protein n=1 Tax=Chitinophaga sp. HK235 TaxID=2952571 RepID=UPI001BADF8D0|nr:hypothetical protein [Chitinophaga sp. HK235]